MPVSHRIQNKLTYKYVLKRALKNLTTAYISNLLSPLAIANNRNLRSSENGSLMVPTMKENNRELKIFVVIELPIYRYSPQEEKDWITLSHSVFVNSLSICIAMYFSILS